MTRRSPAHVLPVAFAALCVALSARAARAGAQAEAGAPTVAREAADTVGSVRDLPLVEVPAAATAATTAAGNGRTLAVFITGDGGWADIDREVAAALAARGVAVVGLDARAYLSTARTPDEAARDVARIARHYLAAWGRSELAIVGYSRGADVAPFVVARMPADLRARLALVALLGPATTVNFQFHWSDLLRDRARPTDVPTLPELERLRGTRLLCVYGADERDSLCPRADPSLVTRVRTSGEHHFDGNYRALGALIADALDQRRAPAPTAPPGAAASGSSR